MRSRELDPDRLDRLLIDRHAGDGHEPDSESALSVDNAEVPADYLDVLIADAESAEAVGAGGSADPGLELIDWLTIHEQPDELVPGLVFPGRWTSFVAAAKAGKSTLLMWLTVELSRGMDPLDGHRVAPEIVLYLDAEMGRLDLAERLAAMGHDPSSLERWHACDLVPRLDTLDGAAALQVAVRDLGASVVVLDGLSGCVEGAEKDDTTWRDLYAYTIAPLKRLPLCQPRVRQLTAENH